MKKKLAVLLAAALTLGMTACGARSVQFVHAVQIKCICSESFDLSGDAVSLEPFLDIRPDSFITKRFSHPYSLFICFDL